MQNRSLASLGYPGRPTSRDETSRSSSQLSGCEVGASERLPTSSGLSRAASEPAAAATAASAPQPARARTCTPAWRRASACSARALHAIAAAPLGHLSGGGAATSPSARARPPWVLYTSLGLAGLPRPLAEGARELGECGWG
jgi:hypothetical protein